VHAGGRSRNVLDARQTILSLEPDGLPEGATVERVRLTLGTGRGHSRDEGLAR
jgi:hypothetical protein